MSHFKLNIGDFMKFKTGILPLDSQLGGGFPGGSVILLLEEPGAGADVLSFHFVLEGLKGDERILYVSTDNTAEELKDSMRLCFNMPEDAFSSLKILDLISPRIRDATNGKDAKQFLRSVRYDPLNGLKSMLESEKFDRVVVNNITYFFLGYERDVVFKLIEEFSIISKKNESIFFMLMTKGMFDMHTETAVKHVADGVIELMLQEVENEMQRRLKVVKLKRVLVPKSVLRYELTEKGIRMESVMRVL
jgi:KaiC/GvpD/RAD55 family RecA-like ATPase